MRKKAKAEMPPGGPFIPCPRCGIGVHFLATGHACLPSPKKG
jgi:hypothetical protein